MSKKSLIYGGSGILASLLIAVGAVLTIILIIPGAEAAASPAAQINEQLGNIRTTGQTIICGPFHEPLIVSGVPISYSKEEGYLRMQDGYMLEVQPFSFYAGKYTALQIDPDSRTVTNSLLVSNEDYYPCSRQATQTTPNP